MNRKSPVTCLAIGDPHFQVNNVDGNIIKPGMYGSINLNESKL